MVNIITPGYQYDPLNLPENLDFHKQTEEFPLSREGRHKLQIVLSRMTKKQIKDNIKYLKQMEYEALEGLERQHWEKIDKELTAKNYNKLPDKLKDDFRMAIWCKFCGEFCEKYLASLEKQKKI